jgi:Resolvase, N terminal domain
VTRIDLPATRLHRDDQPHPRRLQRPVRPRSLQDVLLLRVHIVTEFADNDISATYRKPRPEYRDMIHAVTAEETDCIVIFRTSRL